MEKLQQSLVWGYDKVPTIVPPVCGIYLEPGRGPCTVRFGDGSFTLAIGFTDKLLAVGRSSVILQVLPFLGFGSANRINYLLHLVD